VTLLTFLRSQDVYSPPIVSCDNDSYPFPVLRVGPWPTLGSVVTEERKAELSRMFIETAATEVSKIFQPHVLLSLTINKPGFLGLCLSRCLNVPHICSARGADVGSGIFRPELLPFSNMVVERSHAVTFVNTYLRRTAEYVFGTKSNFHTILNGVNMPPSDLIDNKIEIRRDIRARLRVAEQDFLLGFTGTFREKKGVRVLSEAFAEVHAVKHNTKLLIIGGPRNSVERDKAAVLFNGGPISWSVLNTGLLDAPDSVFPYYLAMDCAVFPSIEDGLANSLLEAMAIGLPVIATDIFEDVIKNEYNGLIVPRYDTRRLSEACNRVIEDIALAKQLGHNASESIGDFSALKETESYLDLFRTIIP
jgi:glycosyltransferase involved in cell wall biosynthesis